MTPVNCILGKGDAMTSKRNVEPPKAKGSPVVEELLREKKGIDEAVVEGWRSACVAVRTGQVQTNKVKRGTRNMSWKAVVCFEWFFLFCSVCFLSSDALQRSAGPSEAARCLRAFVLSSLWLYASPLPGPRTDGAILVSMVTLILSLSC